MSRGEIFPIGQGRSRQSQIFIEKKGWQESDFKLHSKNHEAILYKYESWMQSLRNSNNKLVDVKSEWTKWLFSYFEKTEFEV